MRRLLAACRGVTAAASALAALSACVGDAPGSPAAIDAGDDAATTDGTAPNPTDDGAVPDGATGDGAPEGGPQRKRVFVASLPVSSGDGVATFDQRCQSLALGALGTDKFLAWISTGSVKASDRVLDAPYYLVDATTIVVAAKVGLTTATLANGITKDETGKDVANGTHVFTGTKSNGAGDPDDCDEWKASGGATDGLVGVVGAKDERWTDADRDSCATDQNRVYCFEQ